MNIDYININATSRFNNRSENYIKFRPNYSEEFLCFIEKQLNITQESRIADIGSGTGLFSSYLLKKGFIVYCIEPNNEMRSAAENLLHLFPGFISINGSAEDSTLPESSIDVIIVAQAFHWMNPTLTKKEFTRILKPNGRILICWMLCNTENSSFLKSYEQIKIKYGIDYKIVERANEKILSDFFSPKKFNKKTFTHSEQLSFEQLKGQLLSASFIPQKDQRGHNEMIESLKEIFDANKNNETVTMEYTTIAFWI